MITIIELKWREHTIPILAFRNESYLGRDLFSKLLLNDIGIHWLTSRIEKIHLLFVIFLHDHVAVFYEAEYSLIKTGIAVRYFRKGVFAITSELIFLSGHMDVEVVESLLF